MKKVYYLIICALFLSGCLLPSDTDRNMVLMEEALIYESLIAKGEAASEEESKTRDAASFFQKEEEASARTQTIIPDEDKAALLRQEQDNYAFSSLGITQQNLYVEILYALKNQIEEIELSTTDTEEIDKVFQSVLIDHPEIFYTDGYSFVKYTLGDEIRRITFQGNYIYDAAQIAERKKLIEEECNRILSGIPENVSDYEKVKFIYETIIHNTEYSLEAEDNQNICSVFLQKSSVCQGYAKAVQYLLQKLSIPATLVMGTVENGEGHAWNMVKVNNNYYYLDATWGDASYLFQRENDPEPQNTPSINYDYLCITTEDIERTHRIDHIVPLPECTAREANYYVMEKAYFTEFNELQLVELIDRYQQEGKETVTIKCSDDIVYSQMTDKLLKEQNIFFYLEEKNNSILYTDSREQLSLTFWL